MKIIRGFFLCFLFCCAAFSQPPAAKECELSDADKSSIIEFIFKNDKHFGVGISSAAPDRPVTIYLVNKNIQPEFLPKLPNVSYVLLEPDHISLDEKRESLDYWELQPFRCADSKVAADYKVTTLTHRLIPVAYGLGYEFEKIDDQWVGKIVGMFVTE